MAKVKDKELEADTGHAAREVMAYKETVVASAYRCNMSVVEYEVMTNIVSRLLKDIKSRGRKYG